MLSRCTIIRGLCRQGLSGVSDVPSCSTGPTWRRLVAYQGTVYDPSTSIDATVEAGHEQAQRPQSDTPRSFLHASTSRVAAVTRHEGLEGENSLFIDQEGTEVSLRRLSAFLSHWSSSSTSSSPSSSTEKVLSALLLLQRNAKGVRIDIDDPSDHFEKLLFGAAQIARQHERLNTFIATGKRKLAGSDSLLDLVVSTCVKNATSPNSFDPLLLSQIHEIAVNARNAGQHRTLRSIAALLEPSLQARLLKVSLLPDLDVATLRTYTEGMASHATTGDWNTIWKKRKLLLLASQQLKKSRDSQALKANPEVLLLKAAICKDLHKARRIEGEEMERTYATRRFERLRLLHQDVIDLGIKPDKKWAATLVSGLMRNATSANFNGDIRAVAASLSLPQLLDTRQKYLEGLFEICKNDKGQEAIVFCILEAEVYVASSLITDKQPKDVKIVARLSDHLRTVIATADELAERGYNFDKDEKRVATERYRIYWQQSARSLVMKACHALVQLQLAMGDFDAAFSTLDTMFDRISQSERAFGRVKVAASIVLHREQRNKQFARSGLVNVLLKLSESDMSDEQTRKSALKLADKINNSLQVGIWDVAEIDTDSKRAISLAARTGPAMDLARICIRLIGATSPASSRRRVARHGAKYQPSAKDAVQWQADYLAVVKKVVAIRACAIQRGTEQSCSGIDWAVQPWRGAFKKQIDEEPMRVTRILWSLTASWQPISLRMSAEARRSDPNSTKELERLSDDFCRGLRFLVDDVLIGFGASPRTFRVTLDALMRHRRHIPTHEGRTRAVRIFREGMQQAGVVNIGQAEAAGNSKEGMSVDECTYVR